MEKCIGEVKKSSSSCCCCFHFCKWHRRYHGHSALFMYIGYKYMTWPAPLGATHWRIGWTGESKTDRRGPSRFQFLECPPYNVMPVQSFDLSLSHPLAIPVSSMCNGKLCIITYIHIQMNFYMPARCTLLNHFYPCVMCHHSHYMALMLSFILVKILYSVCTLKMHCDNKIEL